MQATATRPTFRHAGGAAGVAQRGHVLGARRDVRTRPPPPKRLHMVQAHNAYGGARGGLWHASARQPIHNEGLDGGAAADGLREEGGGVERVQALVDRLDGRLCSSCLQAPDVAAAAAAAKASPLDLFSPEAFPPCPPQKNFNRHH
eukprot:351486-Chlamydomonas_euryale.AAC.3